MRCSIRFGNYELIRRLAQGGMAEIFLAVEHGLEGVERRVVVKRILSEMTQVDDFVTMFMDEARVAARLAHPNIAHVYSFGEINGIYYLSMEYVEGLTVAQVLRKRKGEPLPLEVTLRVVGDVCAGLHHAHEARDEHGRLLGVVHRDVSPQNVMISRTGAVKLIDFGVARNATQVHVTGVNQVKGKIAYMAPEMLVPTSERFIDRRADVFATGVLLFEMVTGKRLFRRASEAATVTAVRTENPPSVVDFDAPAELDGIIGRAVEKNADKRYPSARHMQDDLESLIARSAKIATSYVVGKFIEPYLPDPNRPEGSSPSVDEEISSRPRRKPSAPAPFLGVKKALFEDEAVPIDIDVEDARGLSGEIAAELGLADTIPPFDDEGLGAPSTLVSGPSLAAVAALGEEEGGEEAPASPVAVVPPPAPPAPRLESFDRELSQGPPSKTPLAMADLPSRRRPALALGGAALAVVVVGGVLLALLLGSGSDEVSPATSATATDASVEAEPDAAIVLTRPDGGAKVALPTPTPPPPVPPTPDKTPPERDAGAGERPTPQPRPDAGQTSRPDPQKRPAAGPPGTLFVDTEPWSRVRAGGRNLGTTPVIGAALPPGVHVLSFEDPDGHRFNRRVTITSGQPTKAFFRLQ